jgi:hypothetical protein
MTPLSAIKHANSDMISLAPQEQNTTLRIFQQHRRSTNSGNPLPGRESSLQLLGPFSFVFRIRLESYAMTSPLSATCKRTSVQPTAAQCFQISDRIAKLQRWRALHGALDPSKTRLWLPCRLSHMPNTHRTAYLRCQILMSLNTACKPADLT